MPSAVILAAGASRRMGSPKALLPYGDDCLLGAHIAVLSRHVSEVYVVGGALFEELLSPCRVHGARLIRNSAWETTMPIDSLRHALSHEVSAPCVVTPVDTPPVSDADLKRLLAHPGGAVLSYQGRSGHPVVLGEKEIAVVCGSATGVATGGAASELSRQGLRDIVASLDRLESTSDACLLNFNTPEDWGSWRGDS